MTPHEKHEHMALALAVVTKLGLNTKELNNYSVALDILKKSEDELTDPREDAKNFWPDISFWPDILGMVEEIIRVEGRLI